MTVIQEIIINKALILHIYLITNFNFLPIVH